MRSIRKAWLTAACFALVLGSVLSSASASKRGTDFSGCFEVSNIQEQGDVVQVTLHLQLLNHGDQDFKGTVVALMTSGPAVSLNGSYPAVKLWKHDQKIQMEQQFTVNKREFAEWMHAPAQPNILILYKDAQGQSWQRPVQLSRWPSLVPRNNSNDHE